MEAVVTADGKRAARERLSFTHHAIAGLRLRRRAQELNGDAAVELLVDEARLRDDARKWYTDSCATSKADLCVPHVCINKLAACCSGSSSTLRSARWNSGVAVVARLPASTWRVTKLKPQQALKSVSYS